MDERELVEKKEVIVQSYSKLFDKEVAYAKADLSEEEGEALDEDNRKRVAEKVRDTAISLVTAEADHVWPDGERTELRAETFSEEKP